jgi:hypothetical protein
MFVREKAAVVLVFGGFLFSKIYSKDHVKNTYLIALYCILSAHNTKIASSLQ